MPSSDRRPGKTISISPDRLDQSGVISFDAGASVDPAGGNLQYLWEFGDTGKGEGVQVQHIYPSGIFTASLTVINEQGLRSVASRIIKVLPEEIPTSIGINFAVRDIRPDLSEYAGLRPMHPICLDNLRRFLDGEPIRFLVNAEREELGG